MKILLSPHDDDAALFAAFTCIKEQPIVVRVFKSYLQHARGNDVTADQRKREDEAAIKILIPVPGCHRYGLPLKDDREYRNLPEFTPEEIVDCLKNFAEDLLQRGTSAADWDVWAPAYEYEGHAQHNAVALAADALGARSVKHYMTYTRNGGKSTNGVLVKPEPEWILRKLKALACYESQITIGALGCWPHFLRDQNEYMEAQ